MSARPNLAGILEQWMQLTKAEAVAIQSFNWPELKRIQTAKTALREPLAQACKQAAGTGENVPGWIREKVGRIKSLLTRNAETLAARLRQARFQAETLDQAARNLQRIHQSYARDGKPAGLNSYS